MDTHNANLKFREIPVPLSKFFSYFPLRTYPPVPYPKPQALKPTLWIKPPDSQNPDDVLSADVECLKWQAYMALRDLTDIEIRCDIDPQGALNRRLPNLLLPLKDGKPLFQDSSLEVKSLISNRLELIPAQLIPSWVDRVLGQTEVDELEGYKDVASRDESRKWVSLLEGQVHGALASSQEPPSFLLSMLAFPSTTDEEKTESNPRLSYFSFDLSSLKSLLPPYSKPQSTKTTHADYCDAISALSERLGTDKWFLGSASGTPLDALAFAYLHCLLHSKEDLRTEVTRHVNLVAWEWRIRGLVRAAFTKPPPV